MGSVEYRKINRKVIDGHDEKMYIDGSFASPRRVNLGKNGSE